MKRIWTEERDNLLRRHYPKRDLDWVARRIGVSKAALKSRAQKLGIRRKVHRREPWTDRYLGKPHLSLCMPEGVLLGQVEQPHDLFVARTFITYSMTAGLQAEDFAAHRQHILTDREVYERAKEWYR